MSDPQGTLELIGNHLTLALRPLVDGLSDFAHFKQLMYRLGWKVTGLPPEYASLAAAVGTAVSKLEGLSAKPSPADIAGLLQAIKSAYEAIVGIATAPPGVDAAAFLAEIGERLFELLLTDYLALELPAVYNLLQVLNVIQLQSVKAGSGRPSFVRTSFQWSEIPNIISQPQQLPKLVYGWGTADLNVQRIVDHLAELLLALGLPVEVQAADQALAVEYASLSGEPFPDVAKSLVIPFWSGTIATQRLVAAFALHDLPAAGSELPGLVLEPQIPSQFPLTFPLTDTTNLRLLAGTNAASLFGILIRPDGVSIKYPFAPGTTPPQAGIGIGADFKPAAATIIFGDQNATRLTLQGASTDLAFTSVDGQFELDLAAQLTGLTLVLDGGASDSFVQTIIGNGETQIGIPLGVEWSNSSGVRFTGSSAFEVTLHPNLNLGPIHIDDVTVQLAVPTSRPPDLALNVGAAISGTLGPVQFVVQGIGLQVATTFASGNAGPFDIGLGFKPPTGAGLAIDVSGLTGGGFLSYDQAASQYAGMMQLSYQQFQLQAFGLITTRLPTGPGYSLVAMIDATFPPIELVAGFTLNGVGGLFGVNRTISTDALEAGIKAKTLSNFLFAKNPVANAAQLLTDLQTFFPPAEARYIFGPLLQIGWGTPTAITIDLALLLELPDPVRLVLIGELAVLLPNPDAVLLEMHMDVLGTVDFGTDEGSLDAVLHDSRLAKFPLQGSMALRSCWSGSDKTFLLSVGGFHPKFQPPPSFPTLQRVSISMPSGHITKLNLDGYFAVSSNTLQIGAHVDIFVGVDGFGISGYLNFDTLIERNPFYFDGDISGGVTLSVDGDNVMSLDLSADLTGPAPWHCAGSVHFSILGFGVTKSFSTTFGDQASAQPTDLIDVGAQLRAALSDPRNFTATLTANQNGLVSLLTPSTQGVAVGHPAAGLKVMQRVVPLGLTIQKFGAGAPSGDTLFTITAVTADGSNESTTPVQDDFAPAQFLNMSDDNELASPSFETFDAGISLADGALTFGNANASGMSALIHPVSYETWLVDTPGGDKREDPGLPVPPDRFSGILWALNNSGRLRYKAPAQPMVKAATLEYVVATTDQLTVSTVGVATGQTYAQAHAALTEAIAGNPAQSGTLQVVALHEVTSG